MEFRGANGQIYFDGKTVKIAREGFVARMTHGRSEKILHLHQIAAVQFKKPGLVANGFIQFSISGEVSQQSLKGGRTLNSSADENAVTFAKAQLKEAVAIVEAINEALAAQAAGHAAPALSKADEVAKLAELHAQGLLSADEFAAAKAKILGI